MMPASLFSYNIPFTWFLSSCNRQALELFIKGKIQPGGKNKIETKDETWVMSRP